MKFLSKNGRNLFLRSKKICDAKKNSAHFRFCLLYKHIENLFKDIDKECSGAGGLWKPKCENREIAYLGVMGG